MTAEQVVEQARQARALGGTPQPLRSHDGRQVVQGHTEGIVDDQVVIVPVVADLLPRLGHASGNDRLAILTAAVRPLTPSFA